MRLIFSPDAAQSLVSLPHQDAVKLFARLVVSAGSPALGQPWAQRLALQVDGRRVSHGRWRALCRQSPEGDVVVDRLTSDLTPDDAADIAMLLAAEVDELAVGGNENRAEYLTGDQVQELLTRP